MVPHGGSLTSPSHLLRFPIPSWTVDVERSVSPNSSQIMSRKTCVINHRPPSFRFRREDTTWSELRRESGWSCEEVTSLNKESAKKKCYKGGSEVLRVDLPTTSARNRQKCGEFDVGASVGKKCLGKMAKRAKSLVFQHKRGAFITKLVTFISQQFCCICRKIHFGFIFN